MTRRFSPLPDVGVLRRLFSWAAQISMFVLAGAGAFLLRFDFSIPQKYWGDLITALVIWVVAKAAVFYAFKLDRGVWRYFGAPDLIRVTLGNLAGSAVSFVLIAWIAPPGFPRSIYVLDMVLCLMATGGLRVWSQTASNIVSGTHHRCPQEQRALIYGAGDAGVTLLREILTNPRLAYRVCGFLDDHPHKKDLRVSGVTVLGGGEDAQHLVRKYRIDIILIAVPSATGTEMTRILELCHAAGVSCKTVPGLADIIDGISLAGQVRDVALEDLLGRAPVHLEEQQIRSTIEGRTVLVTGAAGSIGSE
ncbi:MAG: hypothetical protein ACRD3S_08005, partial [Terracidiphilus sp.]